MYSAPSYRPIQNSKNHSDKNRPLCCFWKRDARGLSVPYDVTDSFDILIVRVRTANNFGQFIFPKQVLLEQKLLSPNGRGGKRALRIYPPWDIAESKQAKRTQVWQSPYFFEIGEDKPINVSLLQRIFNA